MPLHETLLLRQLRRPDTDVDARLSPEELDIIRSLNRASSAWCDGERKSALYVNSDTVYGYQQLIRQ